MKTRAFKKVLSIVCVLAMLMSVCVVAMVGTASAAETYTFNVNGEIMQKPYEPGAILEDIELDTIGVAFEGWYASIDDFATPSKQVTKAGADKTLYAKLSSVYLDFENVEENNFSYNPNVLDISSTFKVEADPTNPNNTALKATANNGRNNFGVPSYGTGNKPFVIEKDAVYEVSFKYLAHGTDFDKFDVTPMISNDEGTGKAGGDKYQDLVKTVFNITAVDTWLTGSFNVKLSAGVNADKERDKFLFTWFIDNSSHTGAIYFDDITITPIVEKEYTFYDKGEETKGTYTAGDTLPSKVGAYFMGWYDKTLSVRYTVAPAGVTKLYAKYSLLQADFEDNGKLLFDPNNLLVSNGIKIDADPVKASNNALKVSVDSTRKGVAFKFAGLDRGYTLIPGQVYDIAFRYMADVDGNIKLYVSEENSVGTGTNMSAIDEASKDIVASDAWDTYTGQFTMPTNLSDEKTVAFLTFVSNSTAGTVYIDDIDISPYTAPVSTDDFVMEFEDDFKWSVEEANNYTVDSGNGYVSRGEIITEGENSYFRIKHFLSKNSNFYFTIDNGIKQFSVFHCGIYTVKFKYKVEHSETASKIGIALVKPAANSADAKFKELYVVDEFTAATDAIEIREDSGWTEVSYTFGADLGGIEGYTSIALFVYNSTNVPEYDPDLNVPHGTFVSFDDVMVQTHIGTNNLGLIRFNTSGGSHVDDMILPAEKAAGVLPVSEKYGYNFRGWRYKVDGVEYVLDENTKVPYLITDAYAAWELKDGVIELRFRTNDATFDAQYESMVAFPGKPISGFPTAVPSATGQKFVGWYYDREFTQPVDLNKAPAKSQTVYAKWQSTGTLITFDNIPTTWFGANGQGAGAQVTDRMSIYNDNGNNVLYYNFDMAGNKENITSYAGIILNDGVKSIRLEPGFEYNITFKYKVTEASGQGGFGCVLSGPASTWDNRMEQTGAVRYSETGGNWMQATITFNAELLAGASADKNYVSFGVSNNCKVYIDDIVINSNGANIMNFYGTGIVFNTMGGKVQEAISGDPGTAIKLPTPVKPGYKFLGWYTDKELTTLFTDKTFGDERVVLYAKWQLGKFTEGFEEFPSTVVSLGISGAYRIYNSNSAEFDASNIRSGAASLYRDGSSAGVKNFTIHRSSDLALTVGETYTLVMYVKPTAVGDATGTISLLEMGTYAGIAQGVVGETITEVSKLTQGEWNEVKITFTAKTPYVGIASSPNNYMYFDDISLTLKGYTGTAPTGDSSVSPILVLAFIILSAGAIIITGKKVYSK